MPIYDFQCLNCDYEFEDFSPVEFKDNVKCKECGFSTKTLITQSGGFRYEDGYDADLGVNITGPAHRSRVMDKLGLVDVHKSEIHRLRPPKRERDTLHKAHLRARVKGKFSLGEIG